MNVNTDADAVCCTSITHWSKPYSHRGRFQCNRKRVYNQPSSTLVKQLFTHSRKKIVKNMPRGMNWPIKIMHSDKWDCTLCRDWFTHMCKSRDLKFGKPQTRKLWAYFGRQKLIPFCNRSLSAADGEMRYAFISVLIAQNGFGGTSHFCLNAERREKKKRDEPNLIWKCFKSFQI